MEIDISDESNRSTPSTEENGSLLRLVLPDETGDGLPYAPENWPNPGDIWTWRVGKRVASTGHYLDRYLYLPRSLCGPEYSTSRKKGFASKLSVERYIQTAFPGADINAFFASFSWRIPAEKSALSNGQPLLTKFLKNLVHYCLCKLEISGLNLAYV
jgi:hypothetical protein